MRSIRQIAALLLTAVMLCSAAVAEAPFLQHAAGWTLADTPLTASLSASVTTHMPYDDDRLAMLTPLLQNMSLRLTTGQDAGSVTIRVGSSDALTMAYFGNEVQLSSIPELTFCASADPMGKLLGGSTEIAAPFGMRNDAETLLDNGWTLMNALLPEIEAYGNRKNVKTNITDMGLARTCTDYTIPKGDTELLKETLLRLCPEGWLREMIGGVTFSGKQTLRVYQTETGVPLRMEWNGTAGPEGNLRTVKLIWRTRRDETAHRDEVTLTSPAKTGTNKNNLEFERVISGNKAGALEMKSSFSYTVTADKQTTTRKGSFDLTNAYTEDADVITGTITLQQKLPGEDAFAGLTFTPDVTISGTEESPVMTGKLGVSGLLGKNTVEDAVLRLSIQRGEAVRWEPRENMIDLDLLSPEELAQLQADTSAGAAAAIVRPLIILLGGEADWFFRDMSPEQVDRITDAANTVVFE